MANKKASEIQKQLKEIKDLLDEYDNVWQDLCVFNLQNKSEEDILGPEGKSGQMRGKKHAVRSTTLEMMDLKHHNDRRSGLEESLDEKLRRLHRFTHVIKEWQKANDIRDRDSVNEMARAIDARFKRDDDYYCEGISSGDANMDLHDEVWSAHDKWMCIALNQLSDQSVQFDEELERIRDEKSKSMQRRTQLLEQILESHSLHWDHLMAVRTHVRGMCLEGDDDFPWLDSADLEFLQTQIDSYLNDNPELTMQMGVEIYEPFIGLVELPDPDSYEDGEDDDHNIVEEEEEDTSNAAANATPALDSAADVEEGSNAAAGGNASSAPPGLSNGASNQISSHPTPVVLGGDAKPTSAWGANKSGGDSGLASAVDEPVVAPPALPSFAPPPAVSVPPVFVSDLGTEPQCPAGFAILRFFDEHADTLSHAHEVSFASSNRSHVMLSPLAQTNPLLHSTGYPVAASVLDRFQTALGEQMSTPSDAEFIKSLTDEITKLRNPTASAPAAAAAPAQAAAAIAAPAATPAVAATKSGAATTTPAAGKGSAKLTVDPKPTPAPAPAAVTSPSLLAESPMAPPGVAHAPPGLPSLPVAAMDDAPPGINQLPPSRTPTAANTAAQTPSRTPLIAAKDSVTVSTPAAAAAIAASSTPAKSVPSLAPAPATTEAPAAVAAAPVPAVSVKAPVVEDSPPSTPEPEHQAAPAATTSTTEAPAPADNTPTESILSQAVAAAAAEGATATNATVGLFKHFSVVRAPAVAAAAAAAAAQMMPGAGVPPGMPTTAAPSMPGGLRPAVSSAVSAMPPLMCDLPLAPQVNRLTAGRMAQSILVQTNQHQPYVSKMIFSNSTLAWSLHPSLSAAEGDDPSWRFRGEVEQGWTPLLPSPADIERTAAEAAASMCQMPPLNLLDSSRLLPLVAGEEVEVAARDELTGWAFGVLSNLQSHKAAALVKADEGNHAAVRAAPGWFPLALLSPPPMAHAQLLKLRKRALKRRLKELKLAEAAATAQQGNSTAAAAAAVETA